MIPVSKDSLTRIRPSWTTGRGTYEGAYDNTAGAVAVMLYAKALLEIEVPSILSLHCGLVKKRPASSNAFANNDCDYCLPDKELRFYINMDMMGISYPARKQMEIISRIMLDRS